jgi:cobalamin synthase
MIQARAWPVRVMYILIAAALAIGLFITAAPAQKVSGANGDVYSYY